MFPPESPPLSPDATSTPLLSPDMLAGLMPPTPETLPIAEPSDDAADEDFPLSDKSYEEIEEYVKSFCKASREFVERKEPLWRLIQWLYENEITRQDWERYAQGDLDTSKSRRSLSDIINDEDQGWMSRYVHSPSYIVDTWVDNAYPVVFSGAEWLVVIPENHTGSIEDPQFPTAKKLAQLLTYRLEQGGIHTKIYELFQHLCLFGTAIMKFVWYTKTAPEYQWDLANYEQVPIQSTEIDIPLCQIVPLDQSLPDWKANSSDVQLWRGIGNWVRRSYEEILQDIEDGKYTLNIDEFKERFEPGAGQSDLDASETGITEDEDATGLEEDVETGLRVWEWHGRAPTTDDGLVECVVTLVTEDTDDPTDGLMLRLVNGYVLDIGLRPYACAHFTPRNKCFGKGQIENNLPLLHLISQFMGQLQDNTRLTANCSWIVESGSDAETKIRENNGVVEPGMVFYKRRGKEDPIKAVEPPSFNAQEIRALIADLDAILERRTISDTFQGISQTQKTAREAHILQQQAQTPTLTRVDLVARNIINPLGQICLGMLQQFTLEDQAITIQAPGGMDVPVLVTAEEIQSGRYLVKASLTRVDQQEVSKAQSIERVFAQLPNVLPILQMQGWMVDAGELFKRWVELNGVDGADKIVKPIPMKPQPSPILGPDGMPMQDPGMGEMSPGGMPPGGMSPGGMPPNMQSPEMTPTGLSVLPPEVMAGTNGGPMGGGTDAANVIAQQLQLLGADGNPISY